MVTLISCYQVNVILSKRTKEPIHTHTYVSVCKVTIVMSSSLRSKGLTRLLCPWDCPGKNTGVCCQALLQGILSNLQSLVSCTGK